jgi:hypothetical protein
MESMVAGFPLSLVHFTLIHQLVELSTSGGKSISAVASRMTVGAERFSPLTCILSRYVHFALKAKVFRLLAQERS